MNIKIFLLEDKFVQDEKKLFYMNMYQSVDLTDCAVVTNS